MKNKRCICKKILCGVLCAVIAVGSVLVFPQFELKAEAATVHDCSYSWKTLSEGSAYSDLYEIFSCDTCGKIKMKNYMRSDVFVRENLKKQIKDARKDWIVTSELGFYHTLHDEVFVWLTERNDITLVVTYEYEGTYYQTTFPAGADYTEFLQDDVLFYGMPGLNGRCGIISSSGEKVEYGLAEVSKLKGTDEFYNNIKMAPKQETVYVSYGDLHTINKSLLTKLSERNDVTTVIMYEYEGMNYKTTFPAGADYTELLNEDTQFFGMLGLNGRCGIVTEIVY